MKIQTINFTGKDISSNETRLAKLHIPSARPRTKGRQYSGQYRPTLAKYVYELLLNNEMNAHSPLGPKDDSALKKAVIYKFRYDKSIVTRFIKNKISINYYRNMYNENRIYSEQPETFLLSLPYTLHAHPCVGAHWKYSLMAFEECVLLCLHYRKADPRFIPYEQILEIRTRQINNEEEWLDWIVPKDIELDRLKEKFGVDDLYNIIQFDPGLTREETPIDFEPHIQIKRLIAKSPWKK